MLCLENLKDIQPQEKSKCLGKGATQRLDAPRYLIVE